MEKIENKIRNIRELKNLTQEYMADKLGISQAAYSKIENGNTKVSYDKLQDIAKIMGVKVEDIQSFDTQKYFNSFNNLKGNNNGVVNINFDEDIKKLYEDKIILLEKLLARTEQELNKYVDKFGYI
ncbi:MAG: helix-turn-helix transcriptional regulator [Flavobacteriaceae bacterium]|nr:helix-turn-helix transcriptional regulator [Flavobacteriaceae bacterium]